MSTVQVSNITDGTNSVETVYVARGSAKAWVNFNGTGTIAARDSLNLSSLVDNGTGNTNINLTSGFDSINFEYQGSQQNNVSNADSNTQDLLGNRTASAARVETLQAASATDTANVNVSLNGDLA